MARTDDDPRWPRQLLVTAGVLLTVAVAIGVVVGVVAVGAARVTGLGDARRTASATPSLYLPSGSPTTRLDPLPGPAGGPSPSASSSPAPKKTKRPKPQGLLLRAVPATVAPHQRIILSGVYQGHEGARLQVQRFENGAWTDFPVQATVRGGQFSTYITTSHSGENRLRMLDPAGGTSNVVSVTVG